VRWKNRIAAAGAQITLGSLPACRIDAPRLDDIFMEALDNALCHANGEHPLRIAIEGESAQGKVRYSISDNGPGMEEQYREKVFQVFDQLALSESGTGIGLAILRRIAESCGGRAWIEEAPGGGCRLLLELAAGDPGH
jgi:signal transduction histidine kinase